MSEKNIGIITFPIASNGNIPLSNLIDVVYPLSNRLVLITGNEGYNHFKIDKRIDLFGVHHKKSLNLFLRAVRYINVNLHISYLIFKLRKKVDTWIFFIGGDTLLLPLLVTKLLKKKSLLSLASSATLILKHSNDKFSCVAKILSNACFTISTKIILHSKELISEWSMEKYQKKIMFAHEYFLDYEQFNIKKAYNEREELIGYIGTLCEAKGILNFMSSIPYVLAQKPNVRFFIAGKGCFDKKVIQEINENYCGNEVKYVGWIPHDQLPQYLNDLKLLVIPSYTESGPIIALEAMACGTPVLATQVGQILHMIEDGVNGFIMSSNSHDCISKNILRILEFENLDSIIKSADNLVKENFTRDRSINDYKTILDSI